MVPDDDPGLMQVRIEFIAYWSPLTPYPIPGLMQVRMEFIAYWSPKGRDSAFSYLNVRQEQKVEEVGVSRFVSQGE